MPRTNRARVAAALTAPRRGTIRVVWPDPAEPCATLIYRTASGRQRERHVGPRARLTLDQAGAVLGRNRDGVERAIRAGFLRTVRHNGRRYVTMQACRDYERERRADLALAEAHAHDPVSPSEEVYSRLGI
jgi:hypothetical protein